MKLKRYEITIATDAGTSTFEVEARGVNHARQEALTYRNDARGRIVAIRPVGYAQQEA